MTKSEIKEQLKKIDPYSDTSNWSDKAQRTAAETLLEYELRPDQIKVLATACETMDTYDKAHADVMEYGATVTTAKGETKKNPAADIEREARRDIARLFRELNLEGNNPEGRKPRLGGDYA